MYKIIDNISHLKGSIKMIILILIVLDIIQETRKLTLAQQIMFGNQILREYLETIKF